MNVDEQRRVDSQKIPRNLSTWCYYGPVEAKPSWLINSKAVFIVVGSYIVGFHFD